MTRSACVCLSKQAMITPVCVGMLADAPDVSNEPTTALVASIVTSRDWSMERIAEPIVRMNVSF
jgi:hypothetical protein